MMGSRITQIIDILDGLVDEIDRYKSKIKQLEADRDEWKRLYEDLHTLHAEGKLDKSDELIKENQRLRNVIEEMHKEALEE